MSTAQVTIHIKPVEAKRFLERVPRMFTKPIDPYEIMADPMFPKGPLNRGYRNGTFVLKETNRKTVVAVGWIPESFYIEDVRVLMDALRKVYQRNLFKVSVLEMPI